LRTIGMRAHAGNGKLIDAGAADVLGLASSL
jgi:hypothetical protein